MRPGDSLTKSSFVEISDADVSDWVLSSIMFSSSVFGVERSYSMTSSSSHRSSSYS